MIAVTTQKKDVFLRHLHSNDVNDLYTYLESLSAATRSMFQPHPFSKEAVSEVLNNSDLRAYGAEDFETKELIAYALIKKGIPDHDKPRLESYGLKTSFLTDVTLAPSVADAWQNQGVGNLLFQYILSDLKMTLSKRIFLWGGVKVNNTRAVHFYQKNGFSRLGSFHHEGENLDMVLKLAE